MFFAFRKDMCSAPHALNLSDRLYGSLKLSIKVAVRQTALTLSNSEASIVSHYEVGTLAVDGWAVTFGTARRRLDEAAARPGPSSL